MDLDTIRLEVRERLGELQADFFTDSEVDRAINDGLRRFSAEERWPWLVTEMTDGLAIDEDTLDLPQNVNVNRAFNISVSSESLLTPRILERVEPSAGFRLRHAYQLRPGAPRWYYLASANVDGASTSVWTVRVVPTPEIDYDVEYQYHRYPDALAAVDDEPDIPEEYQDAVPSWAAGKLFLKEFSISQKASEQFQLYQKVLEQARKDMGQLSLDEDVAWGREQPREVQRRAMGTDNDFIYGRFTGPLG